MSWRRVVIDWRKPGGKKPPGVVNCARPSRFGNPFTVEKYGRVESIQMFRYFLDTMDDDERAKYLQPLQSAEALACYCKPSQPCHVDALIEYLEYQKNEQ